MAPSDQPPRRVRYSSLIEGNTRGVESARDGNPNGRTQEGDLVTAASAETARQAVRTVIIDDHDVVHAGIEAWCANADPPITFVGNFINPHQFLECYPEPNDEVDVVLFDLQIEGGRPDFETLRQLCESGRRVVVYSHISTDEIILTCLDIGAVTYLVKSEGKAHLIEAIHAASSSTPYMGPRMAKALLNDHAAARPSLSQREKEVLVAWFQTESKDLVGKRLYIAPSTVRTHLQRARAKYAAVGRPAPTKSALLARAIEDGILSFNEL
jgi:DNA-binding NarL/FixJ family response regulator